MAVHGLALLGDKWMHPGLTGLLVPFTMSYRPVATGIGLIAAYGMTVLGLSFYARRAIGAKLWRKAHRFTILFWALAAGHALTAGSDASTPWMQAILAGSGVTVLTLFVVRMLGLGRRQRTAPSAGAAMPSLEPAR